MNTLRNLVIISFLFLACEANAGLSIEAQRVQTAYTKLLAASSNPSTQLSYLDAFPGTFTEFMSVFMPPDFKQLYDGHEYIFALNDIGKALPEQTLNKLLPLETAAHWNADAVNYLQEVTINLAMANPKLFIRTLSRLRKKDQDGVVKFLADGIEGPHPSFLELAKKIESIGQTLLAKQMRKEANISKKRADHEHGR